MLELRACEHHRASSVRAGNICTARTGPVKRRSVRRFSVARTFESFGRVLPQVSRRSWWVGVRAGLERGFVAWVGFFCLVGGVVPGLEARAAAEKLPSGVKTPCFYGPFRHG